MKKSKKGLQPLQPLHRICKSLIIFILNDNDSHLFFVFFQKKIWVLGFTLCMTVRIVKKNSRNYTNLRFGLGPPPGPGGTTSRGVDIKKTPAYRIMVRRFTLWYRAQGRLS